MRKLFIPVSILMTAPSMATAQNTAEENSPLAKLYSCAAIQSNTDRLACFDANVAVIQGKEENREIVAIDAASVKKIKREAFGFSLPSLPKLGLPKAGQDDEETEDLTFPVKSVKKRGRAYTFHMENGQVWRQVNGRFNYIPKGDLTATIKKGSIGSYRISISNGKERVRGMGVKRVE